MLCRKFELIPIKIGFFYEFLKLLQNLSKVPVLYSRGYFVNDGYDLFICVYMFIVFHIID